MSLSFENRYLIFDVPCYAFKSEEDAAEVLKKILSAKVGGYSVAVNAEKLYRQQKNLALKTTMQQALFPVVDGAGAAIALRWLYGQKAIKINLPILSLKVLNDIKQSLVIYGTSINRNFKATQKVRADYPNINIVSSIDGYVDTSIAKNEIITKKPRVVLVGLGSPKQEIFIQEMTHICPQTLFIGCGGALDILSGEVKRAPNFMINNNLEWLFRLIKQPSRWKRQLVLPLFFIKLAKEKLVKRLFRSEKKFFDSNLKKDL